MKAAKASISLLFTALWAQGMCLTITLHNASEFLDIAKNVTKYNGATLVLDEDLDFSGVQGYVPIGENLRPFYGVFDGQGHTVKSLNISTFYTNAGLLGYTTGVRVKNIVLDSSCKANYGRTWYNDLTIGSLIGSCVADDDHSTSTVGGIAGSFSSSTYEAYIKNCVNYGPVTYYYDGYYEVNVGGIVGYLKGSSARV